MHIKWFVALPFARGAAYSACFPLPLPETSHTSIFCHGTSVHVVFLPKDYSLEMKI